MNTEKPIRTEIEYNLALVELDKVFDATQGTPEYDKAELLEILIENYETQHYSIAEPDPIEAIKYLMEEGELKQSDLINILGDKSKVSLVLNKKRKLSLSMIRNIHEKLKIPLNVLIKDYALAITLINIATFLVAFFIHH